MSVFASSWMHEGNKNIALRVYCVTRLVNPNLIEHLCALKLSASYPERTPGDGSQIECKKEKSEGKTP